MKEEWDQKPSKYLAIPELKNIIDLGNMKDVEKLIAYLAMTNVC